MDKLERKNQMTYVNPQIYNSRNLKPDDKKALVIADMLIHDCVFSVKTDLEIGREASFLLERIDAECELEALKSVCQMYRCNRMKFMVSCIVNYEEDYPCNEYPLDEVEEWASPFDEVGTKNAE